MKEGGGPASLFTDIAGQVGFYKYFNNVTDKPAGLSVCCAYTARYKEASPSFAHTWHISHMLCEHVNRKEKKRAQDVIPTRASYNAALFYFV